MVSNIETKHPLFIRSKSIGEDINTEDGLRVLVERNWPPEVSPEQAAIDLWLKELAPSNELMERFGQLPAQWEMFRRAYIAELEHRSDHLIRLLELVGGNSLTLLHAADDLTHNPAEVIRELIEHRLERRSSSRPESSCAAQ